MFTEPLTGWREVHVRPQRWSLTQAFFRLGSDQNSYHSHIDKRSEPQIPASLLKLLEKADLDIEN